MQVAPPQADAAPSLAEAPAEATSAKPYTCHCTVDYGNPAHAEMVMKALSVDPELRPTLVTKTFQLNGGALTIQFAASDVRTLRSAVGSLCDLMGLATRTLEAFGGATVTA